MEEACPLCRVAHEELSSVQPLVGTATVAFACGAYVDAYRAAASTCCGVGFVLRQTQ